MQDVTAFRHEAPIAARGAAVRRALRTAIAELCGRSDRNELRVTSSSGDGRASSISVLVALTATNGNEISVGARYRDGAFPSFHGRLEVSATHDQASLLRLEGGYRVAVGRLGGVADAAGLRRSAEAGLGEFLHLVVGAVEAELRAGSEA